MFVVTDHTYKPCKKYEVNDIKTVADIVVGITGNEEDGLKVEILCGDMYFGDTHISRAGYTVDCVRE